MMMEMEMEMKKTTVRSVPDGSDNDQVRKIIQIVAMFSCGDN